MIFHPLSQSSLPFMRVPGCMRVHSSACEEGAVHAASMSERRLLHQQ